MIQSDDMPLSDQLDKLSVIELNIMLEHLRLGLDHLKKLLSQKQIKELLKEHSLTEAQTEGMISNKAETWGNAALILNTIITSTFGAWMGLSGCIGVRLNSPSILMIVVIFAILLSGIIGYNSFKLTKQKAIQAIQSQKLVNLQLQILKVINQKQAEKITSIIDHLNQQIFQIGFISSPSTIYSYSFQNKEEVLLWFDQLNQLIYDKIKEKDLSNSHLFDIYQSELLKILTQIKKIIYKDIEIVEKLASEPESFNHFALLRNQTIPFIKILTHPMLTNSNISLSSSWLRAHLLDIVLGLAPTLLGGFASMFVFLGGIPNLAKEFGLFELEAFFTHPYSRLVELTMALGLTAYFGFSHIYSSRKSIQRKRLLEKIQVEVTNQETLLIERNAHLHTLIKLKNQIYKVTLICKFMEKHLSFKA